MAKSTMITDNWSGESVTDLLAGDSVSEVIFCEKAWWPGISADVDVFKKKWHT